MPKISKVIGGALILLPLIVFPGFGDEIRQPKAVALLIFLGLGFSFYLWKRMAPEFGAFFAFVTFSAVSSGFAHSYQVLEWMYIAATLAAGTLVVRLGCEDIETILRGIMWGGLINAAYAYVQITGNDFIFLYRSADQMRIPVGFMGQQTLLGPLLAASITVALYRRAWWWVFFMLPVVFLTKSSFTYAGLLAGGLIWLIHEIGLKRTFFVGCGLSIPGVFFVYRFPEYLHAQGRFESWGRIISKTLSDAPIVGHGVGTFAFYAQDLKGCVNKVDTTGCYSVFQDNLSLRMNGIYMQAHSDLVQFFFDGGIIGVLLVFTILFFFVRQAFRFFHVREIACASSVASVILVNSLGNFPMRLVPQSTLAVLCLVWVSSFRRGEYGNR